MTDKLKQRLYEVPRLYTIPRNGWIDRHMSAVRCPNGGFERSLVDLINGWLGYADAHQNQFDNAIGHDRMLGECWAQIGNGLRGLLNGELGRMDRGTLDSLLSVALEEQ